MQSRRDLYGAGRDLHVSLNLPSNSTAEEQSLPGHGYDRNRPLFIQYLNPEVLSCYGLSSKTVHADKILRNSLRATRLAVLLTDACLVFPVSYIFESPCFPQFLREISPLVSSGDVSYAAPVVDIYAYREIKVEEYRNDPVNPYMATRPEIAHQDLTWQPRLASSTAEDIETAWYVALEDGGEFSGIVQTISKRSSGGTEGIEEALHLAPERLAGQALVGRFVQSALPVALTSREMTRINMLLSRVYLSSYLTELRASMLVDFSFGELSCGLSAETNIAGFSLLSARLFDLALQWLGLRQYVYSSASWVDLISLRSMPEFGVLMSELYRRDSPVSFRSAVIKIRQGSDLNNAITLTQAKRAVCSVASQLC